MRGRRVKVLRIYHSGVVGPWRQREVSLRERGVDLTLVSPKRWNEGGAVVELRDAQPWVRPCRTFGKHPYLFVYNPVPIARLLLRERFDVLDVHEEPASLAALEIRLLAWIRHRRTPMLMYAAQNIAKRYPIPFRWIERASLRRVAAVYPCSEAAGEILVEKGFQGIVRQLDLGVETDEFARIHRSTANSRSGRITIGYVGRLEERKGVHVALDALALLPDTFHLEIVGDGPFGEELHQQVERLQLGSRVTFRGHVRRENLPNIYAGFDVAVVPSQTRSNWVEQFGRVAVEIMAAGIPLLVSDSGSLAEVVGGAGIVVPEADIERWAAELERVGSDSSLRTAMGTAGVERSKRFSWTHVAEQQHALYEAVSG